jgi:hypothetical protein
VVLLAGAVMFVRTVRNFGQLDLGFDARNLVHAVVDPGGYRVEQLDDLYRRLVETLSAIPGVEAVARSRVPLMEGLEGCTLRLPDLAADRREACADVGPGFFETMGIPVLRGRGFTAGDLAQRRRLAVVSESFARRFYEAEATAGTLIGGRVDGVFAGTRASHEIVGVVRDARLGNLRDVSIPSVYYLSPPDNGVSWLHVRSAGDPDATVAAIRREITRVDPRLLLEARAVQEEIDRSIARERLIGATSAVLGLFAVMLVSMGIFALTSYVVAHRTHELGIRIALGADRRAVMRESLSDTMLVAAIGLAAGLVASVVGLRAAAAAIADLLFGLTATDAANFVGAVFLMILVVAAACILPVWRATRIDPVAVMRHE